MHLSAKNKKYINNKTQGIIMAKKEWPFIAIRPLSINIESMDEI